MQCPKWCAPTCGKKFLQWWGFENQWSRRVKTWNIVMNKYILSIKYGIPVQLYIDQAQVPAGHPRQECLQSMRTSEAGSLSSASLSCSPSGKMFSCWWGKKFPPKEEMGMHHGMIQAKKFPESSWSSYAVLVPSYLLKVSVYYTFVSGRRCQNIITDRKYATQSWYVPDCHGVSRGNTDLRNLSTFSLFRIQDPAHFHLIYISPWALP